MTRAAVFLAATLVAASLGVVAQESLGTAGSSTGAARTTTERGCLSQAPSGGPYVLTDAKGAQFTLGGNTASLHGYSGQEVQVTGQQVLSSSSSTTPSTQQDAGSKPSDPSTQGEKTGSETIQVVETTILSDHCNASGSSPEGLPGTGGASSVAAANDSAPATVTAHASGNSEDQAADQEVRAAKNSAQLPQTSTMLPLLGLIGLGSLVAGFFARR